MASKKFKILVGSFLILGQLLLAPGFVFAQAVPGVSVPTSDSNNGNNPGGVAGTIANVTMQTLIEAASTVNQACAAAEQLYFNASTNTKVGFSGLSIISGGANLLTNYQADIVAINGPPGSGLTIPPTGFIPCREYVLVLLNRIVANNVFIATQKQTIYNSVTEAIDNLKIRREEIQAKQANASQGFWKTLVFNILIKTSKSVASTLVSKLVNNYKIRDFKQYADSVATLVYDNQFIRQNYPDNQGQMMARAVLNNPLFRREVPTAIFIAADGALGFDPKSLDPGDPNFYAKMALAGSAQANPYFQHHAVIANADLAHSTALAYSQNQISQSQGLKTPVNCAGSLAQQQAIDGQTRALWNQLNNRQKLFDDLVRARQLGMKVLDSDIAKAQADLVLAQNAWDNAPNALPKNNAALAICEAIVSPPSLVNKGIDEAFKAIGVNLAQYNENNLPSFINIIGDVASQIGTNFVLGGAQGAKSAILMNESRVVNAVSTAAGEYVNQKIAENLAKGITFDSEANSSVPNGFTINWEINTVQAVGASFVSITGDGITSTAINPTTGLPVATRYPLSGSLAFITTKGGVYTITVYNSAGRAITSGTTDVSLNVLGAYTEREPLNTRGPEVPVYPRGR